MFKLLNLVCCGDHYLNITGLGCQALMSSVRVLKLVGWVGGDYLEPALEPCWRVHWVLGAKFTLRSWTQHYVWSWNKDIMNKYWNIKIGGGRKLSNTAWRWVAKGSAGGDHYENIAIFQLQTNLFKSSINVRNCHNDGDIRRPRRRWRRFPPPTSCTAPTATRPTPTRGARRCPPSAWRWARCRATGGSRSTSTATTASP